MKYLLLSLLIIFFCRYTVQASDRQVYSVYVVPQVTPVILHKTWTPILNKLTEATGLAFELKIQNSIPAFEAELFIGKPDFSFMNPYHQVIAKKKLGYIPLLHDAKKKLIGIIVVRQDSPIQRIEQLDQQRIAFPAPNAFAASLYTRSLLARQNIEIIPHYVKTHSNVYRHVLVGDTIAGGGVNNTLERESESIKKQLRIIYHTPPSAPHPFSAHPRIAKDVQMKVIDAFLSLSKDPVNSELFNNIQMPSPARADYARDYQFLENLELDQFSTMDHF